MYSWNIDGIFRRLGGNKGVLDLCARHAPASIPPRPDTINLWKFRKRISATWLPVVVFGWLAEGHPTEDLFMAAPPVTPEADDDDLGLESCGL